MPDFPSGSSPAAARAVSSSLRWAVIGPSDATTSTKTTSGGRCESTRMMSGSSSSAAEPQADRGGQFVVASNHFIPRFAEKDHRRLAQKTLREFFNDRLADNGTLSRCHAAVFAVWKGDRNAVVIL